MKFARILCHENVFELIGFYIDNDRVVCVYMEHHFSSIKMCLSVYNSVCNDWVEHITVAS